MTFVSIQKYISEWFKSRRQEVQLKRAIQHARIMSLRHNGRKYYIIKDNYDRLRVLNRDEIIILSRKGQYSGPTDHISLNKNCVSFVQADASINRITIKK